MFAGQPQCASAPPKTVRWRGQSGAVARDRATGYARGGERLTPGGALGSRQSIPETGALTAVSR